MQELDGDVWLISVQWQVFCKWGWLPSSVFSLSTYWQLRHLELLSAAAGQRRQWGGGFGETSWRLNGHPSQTCTGGGGYSVSSKGTSLLKPSVDPWDSRLTQVQLTSDFSLAKALFQQSNNLSGDFWLSIHDFLKAMVSICGYVFRSIAEKRLIRIIGYIGFYKEIGTNK